MNDYVFQVYVNRDKLIKILEAGEKLKEVEEFPELLTEASIDFLWIAKDIRSDILNLMDAESTDGNDPKVMDQLQSAFDTFNGYVRDNLKTAAGEQEAFEQACGYYEDEMQSGGAPDDGDDEMGEAVLHAPARKRSATIVRTKPDGTKEYKFPIPDPAHAKAALAFLNRSDLTPAEKAKVRRKAYSMLGKTPPTSTQTTKESDTDMIDDMEAELQLLDISEATIDLAKGELEVTFLKPGFNRSGYRYYTKDAIHEAVTGGMFTNLKMFMNHQTPQEMNQRPERDLKDWVSTMKECWVDSDGAAKGKVKVVQSWFSSFLKDLQESGSIGEIGLSIFAQGKVKPTKIEGRQTNVVERFQRAMSVDWVTEPGAGGRVDQMWESYQPIMHKEQELNVLQSMTAEEALRELKESRSDVIEALAKQIKDESADEARLQEAAKSIEDLIAQVKQLEKDAEDAKAELETTRESQVKDKQLAFVVESLTKAELPQVGKDRIKEQLMLQVHRTDAGEFDQGKVESTLKESVDREVEYVNSLVKESGGKGIKGLGITRESDKDLGQMPGLEQFAHISAGLDKAVGLEPATQA